MRPLAVVGPTATGKSALAVALAEKLDGEIVNADSMQLYRGMDIGTAKPTAAERRGIRHHVYDVWHVREPASVAVYQDLAVSAVASIQKKGRVPILVGGSGLYVRAVVDRIDFPGTDPAVRERLERELTDDGAAVLYERLRRLDPPAAAAILPTNGRRIVRALEVIELTGRPFSAVLPAYDAETDWLQIGLDRADLDARADARVERMWRRGLVDEVRRLAADGLREGRTARHALGYAQVLEFLDRRVPEDEARHRTTLATRRFVRRQRSWFRRDPRVRWLDAAQSTVLAAALRTLDS